MKQYEYGINLSESERIRKNIGDMLQITKGTVPFDRELGVDSSWQHKPGALELTEMADMLNEREYRAETRLEMEDGRIKAEVIV